MNSLSLPYQYIEVHGSQAEKKLLELRARGKEEGFYPVLIGNVEDASLLIDNFEDLEDDPASLIESAKAIAPADWFKERVNEDPEMYEVDEGDVIAPEGISNSLTVPFDVLTNQPKESVFIVKLPTLNSWEAPAYLKAGGWNECPAAEEHVAIMRYWNKKYGAEVASITGDTFELFVSSPPESLADVEALAQEQFVYCTDIVHQGVETMNRLKSTLVNNKTWFFWWD